MPSQEWVASDRWSGCTPEAPYDITLTWVNAKSGVGRKWQRWSRCTPVATQVSCQNPNTFCTGSVQARKQQYKGALSWCLSHSELAGTASWLRTLLLGQSPYYNGPVTSEGGNLKPEAWRAQPSMDHVFYKTLFSLYVHISVIFLSAHRFCTCGQFLENLLCTLTSAVIWVATLLSRSPPWVYTLSTAIRSPHLMWHEIFCELKHYDHHQETMRLVTKLYIWDDPVQENDLKLPFLQPCARIWAPEVMHSWAMYTVGLPHVESQQCSAVMTSPCASAVWLIMYSGQPSLLSVQWLMYTTPPPCHLYCPRVSSQLAADTHTKASRMGTDYCKDNQHLFFFLWHQESMPIFIQHEIPRLLLASQLMVCTARSQSHRPGIKPSAITSLSSICKPSTPKSANHQHQGISSGTSFHQLLSTKHQRCMPPAFAIFLIISHIWTQSHITTWNHFAQPDRCKAWAWMLYNDYHDICHAIYCIQRGGGPLTCLSSGVTVKEKLARSDRMSGSRT